MVSASCAPGPGSRTSPAISTPNRPRQLGSAAATPRARQASDQPRRPDPWSSGAASSPTPCCGAPSATWTRTSATSATAPGWTSNGGTVAACPGSQSGCPCCSVRRTCARSDHRKAFTLARRSGLVGILPAFVAAGQGPHLAGRPPGPSGPAAPARAGRHPAAVPGGPLGRRGRGGVGRAVVPAGRPDGGISKTEVGDSLDLLLGPLAALGYCQPDGTFITTLADLRQHLAEMSHRSQALPAVGPLRRSQGLVDQVWTGWSVAAY